MYHPSEPRSFPPPPPMQYPQQPFPAPFAMHAVAQPPPYAHDRFAPAPFVPPHDAYDRRPREAPFELDRQFRDPQEYYSGRDERLYDDERRRGDGPRRDERRHSPERRNGEFQLREFARYPEDDVRRRDSLDRRERRPSPDAFHNRRYERDTIPDHGDARGPRDYADSRDPRRPYDGIERERRDYDDDSSRRREPERGSKMPQRPDLPIPNIPHAVLANTPFPGRYAPPSAPLRAERQPSPPSDAITLTPGPPRSRPSSASATPATPPMRALRPSDLSVSVSPSGDRLVKQSPQFDRRPDDGNRPPFIASTNGNSGERPSSAQSVPHPMDYDRRPAHDYRRDDRHGDTHDERAPVRRAERLDGRRDERRADLRDERREAFYGRGEDAPPHPRPFAPGDPYERHPPRGPPLAHPQYADPRAFAHPEPRGPPDPRVLADPRLHPNPRVPPDLRLHPDPRLRADPRRVHADPRPLDRSAPLPPAPYFAPPFAPRPLDSRPTDPRPPEPRPPRAPLPPRTPRGPKKRGRRQQREKPREPPARDAKGAKDSSKESGKEGGKESGKESAAEPRSDHESDADSVMELSIHDDPEFGTALGEDRRDDSSPRIGGHSPHDPDEIDMVETLNLHERYNYDYDDEEEEINLADGRSSARSSPRKSGSEFPRSPSPPSLKRPLPPAQATCEPPQKRPRGEAGGDREVPTDCDVPTDRDLPTDRDGPTNPDVSVRSDTPASEPPVCVRISGLMRPYKPTELRGFLEVFGAVQRMWVNGVKSLVLVRFVSATAAAACVAALHGQRWPPRATRELTVETLTLSDFAAQQDSDPNGSEV